jgi:hypothetical protein
MKRFLLMAALIVAVSMLQGCAVYTPAYGYSPGYYGGYPAYGYSPVLVGPPVLRFGHGWHGHGWGHHGWRH